jgi:hypothetical protein
MIAQTKSGKIIRGPLAKTFSKIGISKIIEVEVKAAKKEPVKKVAEVKTAIVAKKPKVAKTKKQV